MRVKKGKYILKLGHIFNKNNKNKYLKLIKNLYIYKKKKLYVYIYKI